MDTQKNHWENVYKSKGPEQVSWFQPHLTKSLELITQSGVDKKARIIDIGGGTSTLADDLFAKGYSDLTVLDISAEALNQSKKRLGEKAGQMTFIETDILKAGLPKNGFDLWHDRAVFHFLTQRDERKAYLETLRQSLKPGGFVIIASFSLEGPPKCSGLDVMRYSPEILGRELGSDFALLNSCFERHKTPFNSFQDFVYCLYKKS